eukprot:TRINITY_DN54615_c0_g1_i1.p1 TRINITY_DN54615_c0_g1~~TRINITY_DN54615_c0_g1_i1.p1  ORF type:complete len:328 (+),score=35.31 TRINITY_DN54615_c0_g1_i1:20-1003(+)
MYTVAYRVDRAHGGDGVWAVTTTCEDKVVSGSVNGTVNLWDFELDNSLTQSWSHAPAVTGVTSEGNVLACSFIEGSVLISDLRNGEILEHLDNDPGEAWKVSAHGNGEVVAVACGRRNVLLYHVASRNRVFLPSSDGGPQLCSHVLFGGGAHQWLAAAYQDGSAFLWKVIDAGTGKGADFEGVGIKVESHGRVALDNTPIRSIAVSADGQLLACAHDSNAVLLWSIPHRELYGDLTPSTAAVSKLTPQNRPTAISFAAAPFCAVGYRDGKVRIWEIQTRQCVHTFNECHGPVLSLAFSRPDATTQQRLYCASDDGALVALNCNFPGL